MPSPVDLSHAAPDPDRVIAVSDWLEVSQARIDQFAAVTGDRQWIHTAPDRAARESPFHTTIAHGFLTLSLVTELARSAMSLAGTAVSINYGLNRVRFTAPVPAGSRIRGHFAIGDLTPIEHGVQVCWHVSFELEGSPRPCCVVEWLVRYLR
jgi:acyl dehydratase